jgi:N-acetylglucosaminyl-diphospho-decaprenol L-rhamnosyltransferase
VIPGIGARRRLPNTLAQFGASRIVRHELGERHPERLHVAGWHEPRRAVPLADLDEAAHRAQDQRAAEGERRGEHPGLLYLAVGEHDEVGPAKVGRDLRLGHEARDEADALLDPELVRPSLERLDLHHRSADDQQDGVLGTGRKRLYQEIDAFVGPHQAKAEHHLAAAQVTDARIHGSLSPKPGEVVEGAVRDHAHACCGKPELPDEPVAAMLGVGDDRVHLREQLLRRPTSSRSGLAGKDVVGGEQTRAWEARKKVAVEPGNRKPLEVNDVRLRAPSVARQPHHVEWMLGRLGRYAAPVPAVEELATPVAIRLGHWAVPEMARRQLHLEPSARERRAKRVVVRRRVRRGVDDRDPHRRNYAGDFAAHLESAASKAEWAAFVPGQPEISICIVNTNGRELLLGCLASVFVHPPSADFEVLVLDNASDDGSSAAVRTNYGQRVNLVELSRRRGKAENDSDLMTRARGRHCLLLNEASELTEGAADALHQTLEQRPRVAVAGARLLDPRGQPQPSAWRFPGWATAAASALLLHRLLTVQSRGERIREVDWVQSAGMLVRKEAFDEVGPLDAAFFVYSDEVDWQKRARDAGWSVMYVPGARVVHREQLSHGPAARARIVEFARNRDLFVKKHRGAAVALAVRLSAGFSYALRALAALFLPGRSAGRYLDHAYYSLFPGRGEGLREAASRYNRER